jgi:hypothetical protein
MRLSRSHVERVAGDTSPIPWTVLDLELDGDPAVITGCSFTIYVDAVEYPADDTTAVFAADADITDAAAGEIEIPLTAAQAAHTGRMFFQLKMTDAAGYVQTIARGIYDVEAGFGTSETAWAPEDGTPFDPYPIDGSAGFFFVNRHANDEWVYNVPPGPLPVGGDYLGAELDLSDSAEPRILMPTEDVMPLSYGSTGYEWALEFSCDMGVFSFALRHGSEYEIRVDITPGTRGSGDLDITVSDFGSNNVPTTATDTVSESIADGSILCARIILDETGLFVYVAESGGVFGGGPDDCWDIVEFPDAELELAFTVPEWAFPLVPELRFTPTGDGDVVVLGTVRQRRYTG